MLRFLRAGSKRTKTIWWFLIFITVVTFLGGFVFLLGSGLSSGRQARASGAMGVINGDAVGRTEYTNALAMQRQNYKQQYGTEPTDRDEKALEAQTWRSLVYQRLMSQAAHREGLGATDPEIVFALKTQPPAEIQAAPQLQTNGQFDYQKYQQLLADPRFDWTPFEQQMRQQLPTRKFQERIMSSIKVPEGEMVDAYHQQTDKVDATIVRVAPDMSGAAPQVSDADLQQAYEKYKGRFAAAAHTELEVLTIPKKFGADEVKVAHDQAATLVNRARGGEDFAQLARDYSEGPAADKGGVIERSLQPSDFDPTIGAKLTALAPGQILDPFQDQSRFVILKRLPPDSTTQPGGLRMAQIVVRVRSSDTELHDQYDQLKKLRDEAKRSGLGKAASARGLATSSTGPYDANNTPQQLYPTPEAADWGLNAKVHDVSPVFEGPDEFVITQVSKQAGAGIPPRSEVEPALRQLAELEKRVDKARPKAEAMAQALHQGSTLEAAAAANGLTPIVLKGVTRVQPDPRIANLPEVIGTLFGARSGKVDGPIQTINGWYFTRVDQTMPADAAALTAIRTQVIGQILQRRQQAFMAAYLAEMRRKAKIQDLRTEIGD